MTRRHPPRWPLLALITFVVVGAFVVQGDNWVTRGDAHTIHWIAGWRPPWAVDVARGATLLGRIDILVPVALIAGVLLWRAGRGRSAWAPLLAVALAGILDPLVKLIVDRPRPPEALRVVVEHATGYPSGHSAQSAAMWITLALVVAAGRRRAVWRWLAPAVVLVATVGVSRVVLGVHSPSDVLAGWAFGLACSVVALWALPGAATTPQHPGPEPEPV